MPEFVQTNEPVIRIGFFVGVFLLMALWEAAAPWRNPSSRGIRWPNNLGIVLIDVLLVRLVFPISAVGFAQFSLDNRLGLFNAIDVPWWFAIVASIVILDLAIYLQHVLFHDVPALWRLHRMHHADLEFDVTTGLRFHPVEILLSMGIKLAVIAMLGPPGIAVLIFEILLNATSMFNHGNVRIPPGADRVLRWIVVTPDMHRVHHSILPRDTNSNFGFSLPWWDRLLGTYRSRPRDGYDGMTIGIQQFRTRRDLWLDRMLIQPLTGSADGYPINRSDKL